nr:WYL domain-containing protein [Oscillospiraceae bacterium]
DILKKTDEQHPVNTVEILRKLEDKGLVAERKSIARDISVLREAGYSIISCDELKKGFYMTDQPFEDYELKMLADAIAGAKFLTEQDTENLLEKLTQLATPTGEEILKEQTIIDPEIKTDNRTVRYNIDKIITAIKQRRRILFRYYERTEDGSIKLKRNGHIYEISPYYLVWSEDEYYLIGNSKSHDHLTHFHADMITNVEISELPVRPCSEIEELRGDFSICDYLRRNVNMFTGPDADIELLVDASVVRDVVKRFGNGLRFEAMPDGMSKVSIHAVEGEGTLRWLCGFDVEDLKVVSPESIRLAMARRVSAAAKAYSG